MDRGMALWERSSLRCYYMYLSRRLGRCWQNVLKGPLAMGEEVAPPTGFMNCSVVAWLQEVCEPHKTICKKFEGACVRFFYSY